MSSGRSASVKTILVVDNDTSTQNLVMAGMRGRGYRVVTASNGQDPLQLHGGHLGKIDMLIVAVVIPDMSGLELAARLRKLWTDLKVIYISHKTNVITIHGALHPQSDFLDKPFTATELRHKVDTLLCEPMELSQGA